MPESLQTIDKYKGLYVRPTQDAEKDVVKPLLANSFFRTSKLNILLTNYSIQKPEDRTITICEILKYLFPEPISNKIFYDFKEFENFLLAVGKRDHFLHQFSVFLLGAHILILLFKKYPSIEDKIRIFSESDEKNILYAWLMASTYHDFGYPIEIAAGISKKLSTLYKSFGMINLSKIFSFLNTKPDIKNEEVFEELIINTEDKNSHIREKLILKFDDLLLDQISSAIESYEESKILLLKLRDDTDHGFLSAHILGRAILNPLIKQHKGNWEKITDSKLYKAMLKAIAAVALHNLRNNADRKKIKTVPNFYSFLLFLLDNVQDWSRFSTSAAQWPRFWLSNFQINANDYKIILTYRLFHTHWTQEMEKGVKKKLQDIKEAIDCIKDQKHKLGLSFEVHYKNLHPKIQETITISF